MTNPEDEELDVMEFFETEEDALIAKDLLDQYKKENGIVPSGNDNFGIDAPKHEKSLFPPIDPQRFTPAQIDSRYLLETDDMPEDIKRSFWLLGSHHNELLNIQDPRQLLKFARENRDVVRTSGWQRENRKTPYSDIVQIEHYSNRLLTKSWKHGERLLQSTIIQRNESENFDHAPNVEATGGLLGRFRRIFGG